MLCLGYSKLVFKHTLRLVAFTVLPITNRKNEKHWTIIQRKKREEQDYGGQEDFRSAVSKQCFYSVTKAGIDCRVQRQESRESTCQQVPLHYIFYTLHKTAKINTQVLILRATSTCMQRFQSHYAIYHNAFPFPEEKKKRGSLTLT